MSSGGGCGARGLANLMRGRLTAVVVSGGGGDVAIRSSPTVFVSVDESADSGFGGGGGIGFALAPSLGLGGIGAPGPGT